jgi:Ni,Fe-hydrogenase III component G
LHRTEQNGTKRSSALVTAAFSSTVFEWWKTAVSKHRTCLFGNEEP